MTIIPEKLVPLVARTDADFDQHFIIYDDAEGETPKDLTGWTFRFVARKTVMDADVRLEAIGGAITVTALEGRVRAFIERDVLAAAMPQAAARQDGEWALQATGPDDVDAVWAAGKLTLIRGL